MAQIRHKELWKKSCHVVRTCSLRPCVLDQVVFQHIPSFTIHHIHELGVTFPRFHTKDELQTSGSLGTQSCPQAVLPLIRAGPTLRHPSYQNVPLWPGPVSWEVRDCIDCITTPCAEAKKTRYHYLVNKRMNKRIDKNSVLCVFFLFCGYLCYLFCRHRGV